MSKMIKQLRVGLSVFKISTSLIEDDRMASSKLDEVFRILALIFNIKDDEPSSTHLPCLVLVIVSPRHW